MSRVIKSGADRDGIHIRALMASAAAPVVSPDARRIIELESRLIQADNQLAELREEVDRMTATALDARREGHAAGVTEGRDAADDRSDELLRLISDAAAGAGADFRTRLESLEGIAAGLAGIALARIVGDMDGRQAMVAHTVRRAVEETFNGSALGIEVSRTDFPDPVSLESIAFPEGVAAIGIRAVDDLPSGGCRVRLKLGEIDLGLDGQVARLRTLFDASNGDRK